MNCLYNWKPCKRVCVLTSVWWLGYKAAARLLSFLGAAWHRPSESGSPPAQRLYPPQSCPTKQTVHVITIKSKPHTHKTIHHLIFSISLGFILNFKRLGMDLSNLHYIVNCPRLNPEAPNKCKRKCWTMKVLSVKEKEEKKKEEETLTESSARDILQSSVIIIK